MLMSISKTLPKYITSVICLHYSPDDIDGMTEQTIRDQLYKTLNEILGNKGLQLKSQYYKDFFPTNIFTIHRRINKKNHILIDVAHLTDHGINMELETSFVPDINYHYTGYKNKYLKWFNYIYIIYDVIMTPDNKDIANTTLFIIINGEIITINDMLKNRTKKSKKYDHITEISDEMTEKYVEEFYNKKYRLPYKLGGGIVKNNTIVEHII